MWQVELTHERRFLDAQAWTCFSKHKDSSSKPRKGALECQPGRANSKSGWCVGGEAAGLRNFLTQA